MEMICIKKKVVRLTYFVFCVYLIVKELMSSLSGQVSSAIVPLIKAKKYENDDGSKHSIQIALGRTKHSAP